MDEKKGFFKSLLGKKEEPARPVLQQRPVVTRPTIKPNVSSGEGGNPSTPPSRPNLPQNQGTRPNLPENHNVRPNLPDNDIPKDQFIPQRPVTSRPSLPSSNPSEPQARRSTMPTRPASSQNSSKSGINMDRGDEFTMNQIRSIRSNSSIELESMELTYSMQDLFELLVLEGGSDIHISVGAPPTIRLHGQMVKTKLPPLTGEMSKKLLFALLANEQRKIFEAELELDCAIQGAKGIGRFRANIFMNRKGVCGVFRIIPEKIKSFQDLGLPKVLAGIARKHKGLVLVTGPTGSGKSTTLAAMIDLINMERAEHIITIEDPIEFTHEHKRCIVNQREVGRDTLSFKNALKSSLREDPDIILVGELRDYETISMALTAAETGHLVFATLHTSSAYKTVDRMIDVFPPHQQEQVRSMLAESLQAVVAQQLIPTIDEKGRACAVEILINTSAVANLIRENKTHQLFSVMQTSKSEGMQTMDQALFDLLKMKKIDNEAALKRAVDKKSFLRGIKG